MDDKVFVECLGHTAKFHINSKVDAILTAGEKRHDDVMAGINAVARTDKKTFPVRAETGETAHLYKELATDNGDGFGRIGAELREIREAHNTPPSTPLPNTEALLVSEREDNMSGKNRVHTKKILAEKSQKELDGDTQRYLGRR